MKKLLLLLSLSSAALFGASGEELANKFNISASAKVGAQWESIFVNKKYKNLFSRSNRKKYLKKFKTLPDTQKEILMGFLIKHAADSDKPKIAGGI